MRKKHGIIAASLVLAVLSAPAAASTIMLDISGTAGNAGPFTGTLDLNVVNGTVQSGSGTLSIAGLTNAKLGLITTSTAGNETAGGQSAPVGFRDNFGTDIFGADQAYPLSNNGLLFDVGTSNPVWGQFPLFNISSNAGVGSSLFTGTVNGTEYYVETGSLTVTSLITSAAPEPGAWAMMIVGFGFAGMMLRRRNFATALAL